MACYSEYFITYFFLVLSVALGISQSAAPLCSHNNPPPVGAGGWSGGVSGVLPTLGMTRQVLGCSLSGWRMTGRVHPVVIIIIMALVISRFYCGNI